MPLTLTYLDEGHGVVYTASGRITGAEIIDAQAAVESRDRAAQTIWYSLFDFDDITGLEISTDNLRKVADRSIAAANHGAKGRVVGIYAKNNFAYAISRMWMVYVEQASWETAVFRERSEAVAWIRERVRTKFGVAITLT